ncbi:MAG: hypothetical protein E7403_00970 [Ruminococcaceae bacterium]|nr:hypothetical protein [Oscillospiraceae bacterium]
MAERRDRIIQEPMEAGKRTGQLFAEGIGSGMVEYAGTARRAMEQLNEVLLDSQQDYFSEKQRLEEEIAEAEEANQQSIYRSRLRNARTARQIENLQNSERLRQQKNANQEYVDALEEHLAIVEERIRLQRDAVVSAFSDIAQRATKSLEELEKARTKMENKMADYGQLFKQKTVTFVSNASKKDKEVYVDTVVDLSKERKMLEAYADLLDKVKEKQEIPHNLFHSILEMPVEDAVLYQEALLSLDDNELAKYLEDWKAIQKVAKETAARSYQEDTEEILKTVESELAGWYGTVPAGFFQEGMLSAEAFGQGFANKLSDLQSVIQQAMQSLMPMATLQTGQLLSAVGSRGIQNVQNSMTYVLSSSAETVAEQLRSIRAHAAVEQLREG